MKAEIKRPGVLLLTPTSLTEEFALKEWQHASKIYYEDPERREGFKYRGNSLVVLPYEEDI